jgi:hypothetical protein
MGITADAPSSDLIWHNASSVRVKAIDITIGKTRRVIRSDDAGSADGEHHSSSRGEMCFVAKLATPPMATCPIPDDDAPRQ